MRYTFSSCDIRSVVKVFFAPGDLDLKPKIGVPIYIPKCIKARGCRHVCNILSKVTDLCYVETKYDGERMQIHVDLTLPLALQIQIFSKSRNDSTKERSDIIP